MRRNSRQSAVAAQMVQRAAIDITYDKTVPSIYGGATTACCPPLFGQCVDGSIGLFHTGGESELALSWFGRRRAEARRTEYAYLQYMGSVRQANGASNLPGVPAAICDPGETTSFGSPCTDIQDCFGLLKLCSDPMVNGGNSLPYCATYPRFMIDGTQITDDEMWHEANASEALLNDMAYNLIWGVKDSTTNKMGHYGLWSLLGGYGDARDYTYTCDTLAPHILDWGGNPVAASDAQTGITLDGQALGAEFTKNLYATLRSYLRGMRRRMRRTQGISNTNWAYGDWALLGPEEPFECFIEAAACYTECNNNALFMDTERAALKLQELRTAGEGFGALDFDGFEVPMLPFDPTLLVENLTSHVVTPTGSLKNDDGTYNFMLLFRGAGGQRVLQPEYNPLDDGTWDTRDNGMIQEYRVSDDICDKLCVRHEWRWFKRGMPFQLLVKNVSCDTLMDDHLLSSFTAASSTCE